MAPWRRASLTKVRCIVMAASDFSCIAIWAARSWPDRMSPLRTTTGLSASQVSSSAALRMAPAVPSGSSSVT